MGLSAPQCHFHNPRVVNAVVLHRQQHLDQATFARILDALYLVRQRFSLGAEAGVITTIKPGKASAAVV